MKKIFITVFSVIFFQSSVGLSLDRNGNGALKNEAVVLYNFTAGSGDTVYDRSSIGSPLNLKILHPNNVLWGASSLTIQAETLISSTTPATKIINQCKTANEITMEVWVENQVQNDFVADVGPLRIVTLSKGANNTDFFLGQNYDGNHFYQAGVKNRDNINFNNSGGGDIRDEGIRVAENVLKHDDANPAFQHVFVTRDKLGTTKIFVSDENEVPIKRSTTNISGNFNNWNADSKLSLVNELNAFNDSGLPLVRGVMTAEDRPWRGKLHMVAVYCRALTEVEILGARAPINWVLNQSFPIDLNSPITTNRKKAQLIYKRIVGVTTPIDNPVLIQMEGDLNAGDPLTAARRISSLPGFYNRTVKDFGKKMSNREEAVNVEFNDFAAMIVGHTRDGGDARELLYGNFTYKGSTARTAVPSNEIEDLLISNNHYRALENMNYDLSDPQVLVRQTPQKLYNGNGGIVNHKDPAGLITSRAFMSAHAIAGTNRRMVEFSFQEFLCRPIKQWSDNTGADAMVGRDVERFPSGNHFEYQTTCRGCHSQMDPLRGAFGRITFENNFVKHTFAVQNGNNEDDPTTTSMDTNSLIVTKMNRNNDVFPGGWITRTTEWQNNVNSGLNKTFFEWNPQYMSGNGIKEYGRMLAYSGAFPRCMAQRVFRSVCKRDITPSDEPMIRSVASQFSTTDNYKLKSLFERVAITPECLGQN